MKRRLSVISVAMMLVFSIFLTACGGGADSAKEQKNSVTLAMFSKPTNSFAYPFYDNQYDAYILKYLYDSLWDFNEKMVPVPQIAERWEFSEDKRSLTFYLRKDVKWHDGKPFTAEDVAFTWEVIADPDYQGKYFETVELIQGAKDKKEKKTKNIAGITIIDPHTIRIELEKPYSNTLGKLWSKPIAKHVYEGTPVKNMHRADATMKKPVGTGPFKLKESKNNEYYVLEKNKEYYIKGKPHLDQIIWKVMNQDVAVGALIKGDVDGVADLSPSHFKKLRKSNNVQILEKSDLSYQYLGINNESPKLQDKRMRQALAYAIDRQALVSGLMDGHGYVINQSIVKESWAYNEELEDAYPYDVNKAKQLLAEMGYQDVNNDGFVEDPQGKPFVLKLDYPTGNPVRVKSAPIIKQNIEKAGIKIDLKQPRDLNAMFDMVERGDFELYLGGWSLSVEPDPAQIWRSDVIYNYPKYKNPKSDELLDKAVTSPESFDLDKRKKIYAEWTKLIAEDQPIVFLYSMNKIEAFTKRVKNVKQGPMGAIESHDVIDWTVE